MRGKSKRVTWTYSVITLDIYNLSWALREQRHTRKTYLVIMKTTSRTVGGREREQNEKCIVVTTAEVFNFVPL